MSHLFALDEQTFKEQVISYFDKYEAEINKAEPLFDIEGERLEVLARTLPKHQAHYSLLAKEAKALMQWLENAKSKEEATQLKNLNRGPRALSATDQRILLAGEKSVIELNQVIIALTEYYNKFEAIVEAFVQMGWMLGNITKLRVAELHEVII